jgi:phosphoribosylanthranilate isomerase
LEQLGRQGVARHDPADHRFRLMRVKVCGIRRLADGLLAAQLGADAIGVLVGQSHPSGDFITAGAAASILRALPPFVSGVLVSHWSDPTALLALITRVRPAALQLHSGIPVEAVRQLRQARPELTLLKAVHINQGNPLETLTAYGDLVDGFVADSCNPATGQVGGTGLTHDWAITAELVQRQGTPVLLAGGLTPANVADAIRRVRPYGVDVNSGVKGADGFKDGALLEQFIQRAKG